MNDSDLAVGLREWFKRMGGVSGQARRKNPVWVALREITGAFGNWRNARRGNPRRGYLVMRERMNHE